MCHMDIETMENGLKEQQTDYLYTISDKYSAMSGAEKVIADRFLSDRTLFTSCSITTLARKLNVSPASITRFCQKLNYSGFSEFKHSIASNALIPLEADKKLSVRDSLEDIIGKLTHLNQAAIQDSLIHLNRNVVQAAVQAICKANMIHIYGEGGPGAVANYAYQLFFQIGLPCHFFNDAQLALISAMQLKPGDVVICICRSGQSKSLMRTVTLAKERKVTIIGVTAAVDSDLAGLADICLRYSSRIENDLRYLHVARICELSVIGVLFSAIINQLPDQTSQVAMGSKKAISMNLE